MQPRELAADGGLPFVVVLAGEDEMIVGDGGPARKNQPAAGNLIERMNGERRGAVRGRKQIGVHAQRGAGTDPIALVDAVGPHDLFGRGEGARGPGIGPFDARSGLDRASELAPAGGEDSAGPADLILLRRERHRLVGLAPGLVGQAPRLRLEAELVAVTRIRHRLRTLDDVQSEVQGVAAEDVAHVGAADDNEIEAGFFGDCLQAGWAHLARRSDREAIAGDDERFSAVNAGAEVRHQVAERAGLPTLVKRGEALRNTVGRRRNLIGVDGVELLAGDVRVPEDERCAANHSSCSRTISRLDGVERRQRNAGLQPGRFYGVHLSRIT